jgi:fatty-acyl-CoA synthase
MQDEFPLTIQYILNRMRTINGASEVVTLRAEGVKTRATYAEVGRRVDRLAAGLAELGVSPGDRVATFMWNSQEHLEIYMAVPASGAVLHTLNLRLFPEQLTYIVNHADDQVIFVDDSLIPLLAKVAPTFRGVKRYVVIGDGDIESLPGAIRYADLLDHQSAEFEYPPIDDRAAAGLCYTSGTTGDPKGVLYSHRSNVMHAIAECMTDTMGIGGADRVLPVVPMFHANAWGLPYSCTMVGADLVMPGPFLQAEPLATLIQEESVTVAGAVPTIWMELLRYADEHRPDFSSLRIVPCGGAAVPRSLMEGFAERHGVPIVQAWGMTETSPLGAVAHPPRGMTDEEAWSYRTTAGRICPLVEARIVEDGGEAQPWDGRTTGELQVRGPWIASAYFEAEAGDVKFSDDGWLKTGDVAAITHDGYIRITDRAKDVIKSGGEWISSVDLENELMAHPSVLEAAVIAKPDERWSERPLACVVLVPGSDVQATDLAEHLRTRVAKWWLPDEYVFVTEIPKTSVGKFDKKVLRAQLAEDELDGRRLIATQDASQT